MQTYKFFIIYTYVGMHILCTCALVYKILTRASQSYVIVTYTHTYTHMRAETSINAVLS